MPFAKDLLPHEQYLKNEINKFFPEGWSLESKYTQIYLYSLFSVQTGPGNSLVKLLQRIGAKIHGYYFEYNPENYNVFFRVNKTKFITIKLLDVIRILNSKEYKSLKTLPKLITSQELNIKIAQTMAIQNQMSDKLFPNHLFKNLFTKEIMQNLDTQNLF